MSTRRRWLELVLAVSFAVAIGILGHALTAGLPWVESESHGNVPRGWEWWSDVAWIAWFVPFIALACAWWVVRDSEDATSRARAQWLVALLAVCAFCPVFIPRLSASGPSGVTTIAGEIFVPLFGAVVVLRVRKISKLAAAIVSIVPTWGAISIAYVLAWGGANG